MPRPRRFSTTSKPISVRPPSPRPMVTSPRSSASTRTSTRVDWAYSTRRWASSLSDGRRVVPPTPVPRATSTTSSTPIHPLGAGEPRSDVGGERAVEPVDAERQHLLARPVGGDHRVAGEAEDGVEAGRLVGRDDLTPPLAGGKWSAAAASTMLAELVGHSRPASMMRRRNCRVRSSVGSLSTCSGGPSSSTRPSCEEADPVGDVAGEAHLVGGEHHGHPAGRERRGWPTAPRPPARGRARR